MPAATVVGEGSFKLLALLAAYVPPRMYSPYNGFGKLWLISVIDCLGGRAVVYDTYTIDLKEKEI